MLKRILQHCGVEDLFEKEDFPTNFFPVPPNYIVYQTGSEKKSQVYDYSVETISLIRDVLEREGISIVQVGDVDDPSVPHHLDLRGQLSARQLAYVIKNSRLCVTSNKFSSKLCRVFEKGLILLGSNFPSNFVVSDFADVSYVEPDLKTERWTYQEDEVTKLINTIRPEEISQEILDRLEIFEKVKFETLYMGEKFGPQILEFIPDFNVPQDIVGKQINVRLDEFFNPDLLPVLTEHCKTHVTTKQPFDLDNLNTKGLIGISYFCDETADINFVKKCVKNRIKIYVICSNIEHLNNLRFDLLGIVEVYKKIEQKSLDFSSFYGILFKSSRIYIGRGQLFPSLYHYKKNLSVDLLGSPVTEEMVSDQDFLEGRESFYIFKV